MTDIPTTIVLISVYGLLCFVIGYGLGSKRDDKK